MDDIILEFIAETNENLEGLDNALVTLEQNPDNDELISQIFRVLHTIKGTCGFLGLSRLESVAHRGEDVLGLFRDKKLTVKPEYVSLILESFDRIKDIVEAIEQTGEEPAGDDSELKSKLEAVYNSVGDDSAAAETDLTADIEIADATAIDHDIEITHENPEHDEGVFDARNAEENTTENANEKPEVAPVAQATQQTKQTTTETASTPSAPQSLRVNVDVLENLMTMVSELVLTRNQLLQIARQNTNNDYQTALQRLNLVVSELQDGVMKTRMQPVGNAWAKLPRIVRDISQELRKKIDLEMYGHETELDRQVLDLIKDPLTHMVRNSVDHGIEYPAERAEKGKPENGKITLNAFHQGGHINIEISDDGKGLPIDKIKQKILDKNLATEEQINDMSAQQIQQFIFHASFSTAEQVTSVSGRGVGMDVVKTNIEKIGGSIEMRSEENVGTTFTIRIPLTLAIMSSLIVGIGEHRFAIPQLTISELVLVGRESGYKIEEINDSPVLRLRDNLLPLVSISDLFGIHEEDSDAAKYVVVTRVGSYIFGLVVDHIYDFEEIVVKPLSKNLKNVPVFSGNTILGDGEVIMILDPVGILKTVGVQDVVDNQIEEGHNTKSSGKESLLLLFKAGDNTLKAVPADMVSRLEDIKLSHIEHSKGQKVTQYLDHLMPIFDMDTEEKTPSSRPLIILKHEGKNAGLIVDQIVDITKYNSEIQDNEHSEIVDSIIINETAVDIINAPMLAQKGIFIEEDTQHDS